MPGAGVPRRAGVPGVALPGGAGGALPRLLLARAGGAGAGREERELAGEARAACPSGATLAGPSGLGPPGPSGERTAACTREVGTSARELGTSALKMSTSPSPLDLRRV